MISETSNNKQNRDIIRGKNERVSFSGVHSWKYTLHIVYRVLFFETFSEKCLKDNWLKCRNRLYECNEYLRIIIKIF